MRDQGGVCMRKPQPRRSPPGTRRRRTRRQHSTFTSEVARDFIASVREVLEEAFKLDNYICGAERARLAGLTGLTEEQVRNWVSPSPPWRAVLNLCRSALTCSDVSLHFSDRPPQAKQGKQGGGVDFLPCLTTSSGRGKRDETFEVETYREPVEGRALWQEVVQDT